MSHTIVFELDSKKVLNANESKHVIVKGKIVSFLRSQGAQAGLELHPEGERRQLAERHVKAVRSEHNWVLLKKRARAVAKKARPSATLAEINKSVEELYEDDKPVEMPVDVPVVHLYNRHSVLITVHPPTKRRIDPPNLYPTVKPLIDGLTDAGLWPDDSFEYQDSITFKYGGSTGVSGQFKIVVTIEPVD